MIRELLQIQITEAFGLIPGTTWATALDEGLAEMTFRYHLDEKELAQRATTDVSLLRELAGYLTIDESYFLRHAEHYPAIIERLANALEREGKAFVWSVGCARGEEPYTVAILLRQHLGAAASQIRILATDICPRSLNSARRGFYREWSFRGTPEAFIERNFQRQPDGAYRIDEAIMSVVEFELGALPHRLVTVAPSSVDVVLFRNVAIYIESQTLAGIYERFAAILGPEGLLVTAPADPPPPRELFARHAGDWHGVFASRRAAEAKSGRAPACRTGARAPSGAEAPPPRPQVAASPGRESRRLQGAAAAAADQKGSFRHGASVAPAGDRGVASKTDDKSPREAFEEQLREASKAIESVPASPAGYLRRGRLHLAILRPEEAARDFRSALYLDPNDPVARFWYATALHRAGKRKQARTQALRLTEDLERVAADAVLSDGVTRASKLLDAVLFMRASLV